MHTELFLYNFKPSWKYDVIIHWMKDILAMGKSDILVIPTELILSWRYARFSLKAI